VADQCGRRTGVWREVTKGEQQVTRVAIVTGGADGIGLAISQRLARQHYSVAIFDVNGDGAQQAATALNASGLRAMSCTVDVSDRAYVDAAMAAVRSEFGPIEILVNNAAVALQQPFADMTLEQWNRMLAINLTGAFNCVQSAIPDMVAAQWGRVVLISSSSAQRGAPKMAHYAASKGGIIALTKTLALEYAAAGLTVNNIAPSSIETPSVHRKQATGDLPPSEVMGRNIPVGRMGRGEDIAHACAFLISDESSYITGQTLSVNGGSFVG
jgi:2-hydroxycyclohexanecarboxyl-CoA dehydrogenase